MAPWFLTRGPFFLPFSGQYWELRAEHLPIAGARLFCCPNLGARPLKAIIMRARGPPSESFKSTPKQLERLGGKLNEDYHDQGLLWKLSGSAGG